MNEFVYIISNNNYVKCLVKKYIFKVSNMYRLRNIEIKNFYLFVANYIMKIIQFSNMLYIYVLMPIYIYVYCLPL